MLGLCYHNTMFGNVSETTLKRVNILEKGRGLQNEKENH